ncbi:MAG: DUF4832 domain-containing protein [Paludibacteraceae bacterium]|nr:DUF4832 domain-containing protein [Paludibacteraceae bacterium]
MRNSFYILVLLFTLAFVACKPVDDPVIDDGMQHDSLKASYEQFCNPERGFHVFMEFHSNNIQPYTAERIRQIRDMGYSLVLNNYYLDEYRESLIAESYLDIVRQNMQALREGGCKCILRFAYTSSENQHPHEAPVDLVLQHIAQIKPILQEYADVIFVMEAGFVGVWGEWYYTTYFKQNPMKDEDYVDRRRVLDALLDALPKERQICVRTPDFKLRCYGWSMADTLTRAEAFTGTPKARLAAHDDAFMANESDMGTFTKAFHRNYWNAETRYTVFGGETNQPGDYANCDNSLAKMQDLHISYLNISYHKAVIANWQKSGCFEDMKRLMGYRLVVTDVATTKKPVANDELKVVITLENEGFSSPKNPRDVRVLLVNKTNPKDVYTVTPGCDPRFWFPDEGEHKVEVAFRPKNAGQYDLFLFLPDPQPTLAKDPRFAIRLANENCWDENTGYNYLTTVTVQDLPD